MTGEEMLHKTFLHLNWSLKKQIHCPKTNKTNVIVENRRAKQKCKLSVASD
jgi:hypothetical protein